MSSPKIEDTIEFIEEEDRSGEAMRYKEDTLQKDTIMVVGFLTLIFVMYIMLFMTLFIPGEQVEKTEYDENGDVVSVSVSIQQPEFVRYLRGGLLAVVMFFIFTIIFLINNRFYSREGLRWGWIFATPFLFVNLYLNHLFMELPCPQHHDLEFPMALSGFIFNLVYVLIFITVITETSILIFKVMKKRNEP